MTRVWEPCASLKELALIGFGARELEAPGCYTS
jgi:hypothetical protein